MRVLVVASHSAGHILPAIAFCQGLEQQNRDTDINFVTTDGELERRLLNNIKPVLFFKKDKLTILNSYKLIKLTLCASSMIKKIKPNLIVGFGGYLSIPFIICAYLKNIPNFIHEQNFDMGLANKFLARLSDQVIFSFPNSQISDKLKNKALFLGLPLRKEIKIIDKKEALSHFDLNSDKFTLLVMGGSQGAVKINSRIIDVLRDSKLREIQIIHISGPFDYKRVEEEYKGLSIEYRIFPFIDRINYALSACDLVVCRAGAGTIAEVVALRKPSILIPYPFAKQHQLNNARFLSEKHAAILVRDEDCSSSVLREEIINLKNNSDELEQMSQALKAIDMPDARRSIAGLAFNFTS